MQLTWNSFHSLMEPSEIRRLFQFIELEGYEHSAAFELTEEINADIARRLVLGQGAIEIGPLTPPEYRFVLAIKAEPAVRPNNLVKQFLNLVRAIKKTNQLLAKRSSSTHIKRSIEIGTRSIQKIMEYAGLDWIHR